MTDVAAVFLSLHATLPVLLDKRLRCDLTLIQGCLLEAGVGGRIGLSDEEWGLITALVSGGRALLQWCPADGFADGLGGSPGGVVPECTEASRK